LKKQVEELKAAISKNAVSINNSLTKTAISPVAHIKQINPNPFNVSITIGYYVPQTAGKAVVEIFSSNGQLLKTLPVSQTGEGFIDLDAAAFSSDTYTCVLKVNGIRVDSKQIVHTK